MNKCNDHKDLITRIINTAKKFGCIDEKNGVIRENNDDFFVIANAGQPKGGVYNDLSFVIFYNKVNPDLYLLSIGVGSGGFKDDYEEASLPRWRRLFSKLLPRKTRTVTIDDKIVALPIHCKLSFADIFTPTKFSDETELLGFSKSVLDSYKNYLPISVVINTKDEDDIKILEAWLAQYAKLRNWHIYDNGNDKTKKLENIKAAIETGKKICNPDEHLNDEEIVENLLERHRYVILQGAPGVGKTYLAEQLAKKYEEVCFIQFHAETSYSDFVYGIVPDIHNKTVLRYDSNEGVLIDAIKKAQSGKKTLLIIDEINRANLANVLGPVFYLFEPYREYSRDQEYGISLGGKNDAKYKQLPENLHVIGTMNTADRSIAVVDYALRRRFAWYTITPKPFNISKSKTAYPTESIFHNDIYSNIEEIFESYASDDELNLQPGPSYFLTKCSENKDEKWHKEQMLLRLEYELMPLIKEYLNEGLLIKARDEFSDFFYAHTGKFLFR